MAHIGNPDWQIANDDQSPFLSRNLRLEILSACELFRTAPWEPYATIDNVLTDDALESLGELDIPENGKCNVEELIKHPVGRILVSIMGKISMCNPEYDLVPERVSVSLRNETGEDVVLPAHRDLLDGHAALFNWDVSGDLRYIIDEQEVPLTSNVLLVLNGAANWQEVTSALPEESPGLIWRFGGTTAVHSVIGHGPTSRNRLLVYADGQDTNFTQIFEDEYGPVPGLADSLLFTGLRPSLGIYVE